MSHKSNKSAKAAFKRAVGSENKEKNKHITKITATPSKNAPASADAKDRPVTAVSVKNAGKAPEKASDSKTMSKKSAKLDHKAAKAEAKKVKADKKAKKSSEEKPLKEVFILARPFVALGRYIRDSWREIRRVRWPNRKATWKMTGAVLAYCVVFMVFIVLLDSFFTWLFSLIIK